MSYLGFQRPHVFPLVCKGTAIMWGWFQMLEREAWMNVQCILRFNSNHIRKCYWCGGCLQASPEESTVVAGSWPLFKDHRIHVTGATGVTCKDATILGHAWSSMCALCGTISPGARRHLGWYDHASYSASCTISRQHFWGHSAIKDIQTQTNAWYLEVQESQVPCFPLWVERDWNGNHEIWHLVLAVTPLAV